MNIPALRATARSAFLWIYFVLGGLMVTAISYSGSAPFVAGVNLGVWGLGMIFIVRDTYLGHVHRAEIAEDTRAHQERLAVLLADN